MKKTDIKADMKLTDDQLNDVTGGVWRMINTGASSMPSKLYKSPSGKSEVIIEIPNGSVVDTIDETLYFDSSTKRNYVEITFRNENNEIITGWIKASHVGLHF